MGARTGRPRRLAAGLALVALTTSLLAGLATPARATAGCNVPMPCCAKGMCLRQGHDDAAHWSRCHEEPAAALLPVSMPPAVLSSRATLPVPRLAWPGVVADAFAARAAVRTPETPPPQLRAGLVVFLLST